MLFLDSSQDRELVSHVDTRLGTVTVRTTPEAGVWVTRATAPTSPREHPRTTVCARTANPYAVAWVHGHAAMRVKRSIDVGAVVGHARP